MLAASYAISSEQLWHEIGTVDAPRLFDVRRRDIYEQAGGVLPGALWQDPGEVGRWSANLDRTQPIVVTCQAGHALSQGVVAQLRAADFDARMLAGGYDAWQQAGLPLVNKATLDRLAPQRPSVWVTRRRPKIDRVACPC